MAIRRVPEGSSVVLVAVLAGFALAAGCGSNAGTPGVGGSTGSGGQSMGSSGATGNGGSQSGAPTGSGSGGSSSPAAATGGGATGRSAGGSGGGSASGRASGAGGMGGGAPSGGSTASGSGGLGNGGAVGLGGMPAGSHHGGMMGEGGMMSRAGGGGGHTGVGAGGAAGAAAMGGAGGASSGSLSLSSPDQPDGAKFTAAYTCAANNGTFGAGVNPELDWTGAPTGTQSFAMTFIDTKLGESNAMGQHWAIWDIPATVTQLPKGTTVLTGTLAGAKQTNKYLAPCPSGNDTYAFTLYALSETTLAVTGVEGTGTSNSAGVAKVLAALKAVTPLGTAKLTGTSGPQGK
jgi:phosphatidylethanolamine-binding protein (PEBP) family uncharacterized protein